MEIKIYQTGPLMVNTYLAWDETKKGFIVDPGGFSQEIAEQIRREDLDIEYIILTHGHGDHIGGVEKFKDQHPNVKVLACSKEAELLENADMNTSKQMFGREIVIRADEFVNDGDTLTIGNMNLTFLETPGHTKGGMCILVDRYVFSGDTLFRQSIGRTDFYGGSFPEILRSIREKLFVLPDDTVVLPGHMGTTEIGFEKEHNPFVR